MPMHFQLTHEESSKSYLPHLTLIPVAGSNGVNMTLNFPRMVTRVNMSAYDNCIGLFSTWQYRNLARLPSRLHRHGANFHMQGLMPEALEPATRLACLQQCGAPNPPPLGNAALAAPMRHGHPRPPNTQIAVMLMRHSCSACMPGRRYIYSYIYIGRIHPLLSPYMF